MARLSRRMGGVAAVLAAIAAAAPGGLQAASTPSVVSVTGIVDGAGTKTVLDILLTIPPGGDEQAAVDAALKAAGAHKPGLGDVALVLQPFVVNGFTWTQFSDKSKRNNVVTYYYNPAGDPTGGAALAAIQNAAATWSSVRGSSFRLAYGGETTLGQAFDGVNTVSWGPLFGLELGVTTTTWYLATGQIIDADVRLLADMSPPPPPPPPPSPPPPPPPPPPPGLSWHTDGGDVDVETVMLHEDGHVAGLGHSAERSSIMFPFYIGVRRALDVIDTDAITFLYPAHTNRGVTPRSSSLPFRLVATLGDLAPGGGLFEEGIEFEVGDLNARGDASFASELTYRFLEAGEGLYVASRHGIVKLESTFAPAPGGGTFDGGVLGRVSLNDAGDAAFASLLAPFMLPFGRNAGVYGWDSSHERLTALVVPGVTSVPTGGVFEGAFGAELSKNGDVAFGGMIDTTAGVSGALGMGVFRASRKGELSTVAAPGTPAPGGGVFDFAGNATLGDGGDIGFDGHVQGQPCLATAPQTVIIFCLGDAYVRRSESGVIERIAGRGDPAPGGGVFSSAGSPLANSRGDVLFAADLTPAPRLLRDVGLYLSSTGTVTSVVRPGDSLPGGGRLVTTGLAPPEFSFSESGQIAFAATLDTDDDGDGIRDTGVYVSTAGDLQLIARTGTVVPGVGTIAHIQAPINVGARRPTGGAVLNSRGDVLFEVTLTDGRGVLLVAQR